MCTALAQVAHSPQCLATAGSTRHTVAEVAPPALAPPSLGAAAHYETPVAVVPGSRAGPAWECPVGPGWGLGRGSEPWYLLSGEVVE